MQTTHQNTPIDVIGETTTTTTTTDDGFCPSISILQTKRKDQMTTLSTTAHAALFAGLDFTLSEWLRLMDAICGRPSYRRDDFFRETVDDQQSELPTLIADACLGNGATQALADRVHDLSPDFRIAILEVAEQFWVPTDSAETNAAKFARMGLRPTCNDDDRLRARQFRDRHDAAPPMPFGALQNRREGMAPYDTSSDSEIDREEPDTQDLLPAYVCRRSSPLAADLPTLDAAKTGDVVALVSGYRADFDERTDLHRELEGFYIAGETDLTLKRYDELTTGSREVGAQLALDHLFLASDVHGTVLRREMVCDPVAYQLLVVTFADARILVDIDVIRDPDEVRDALDGHPNLAPCVIEIFGEEDDRALIAKAGRYLEIVRTMLPERERPEAPFLELRLGGC